MIPNTSSITANNKSTVSIIDHKTNKIIEDSVITYSVIKDHATGKITSIYIDFYSGTFYDTKLYKLDSIVNWEIIEDIPYYITQDQQIHHYATLPVFGKITRMRLHDAYSYSIGYDQVIIKVMNKNVYKLIKKYKSNCKDK